MDDTPFLASPLCPDTGPPDATLAACWSDAARRFSGRIALRAGDTELTYHELNQRAVTLAAKLVRTGLGPGEISGIYLGRSVDCVVSILAVTLAGAAWLPLDPNYPAPRLRLMAADAGITHLISNDNGTSLALDPKPVLQKPGHLTLSADTAELGPWKNRNASDDLAYVMYTSGSTGRPKGIQIEHGSLVAFLQSMQTLLPPAALRHVLSVSSPSFDISLLELLLPLVCGGTVTLASHSESRDGRLLAARLDAEKPSLIQATPATWRMLLAAGWRGHDGLTLITGGEAISCGIAGSLLSCADAVWNLYGPTEATIWATATLITPQDVEDNDISIGRALPHMETLVLDDNGARILDDTIGELYLLGSGLSRGYVDQPELTNKKFLDLPEGRAYRTGDRVSQRPDGRLSFHGRVDYQIKHNGTRIEPAEVETVLKGHSAISDAVVAARDFDDGDRRLVAYVVPESFDPGQNRRRRLTDHWRAIWTREYNESRDTAVDAGFNTAGLRSSYDDKPIEEAALRDNVEQICARVRALAPRQILDLGCGSGLLLFPLAPQCERYVGVDFSEEAITSLKQETARRGLGSVQLLSQPVNESSQIEPGSFDMVLLNTVIQYFPDTEYLEAVLENALRALRPGGVIFVGDVRELGCLEAFHASVVRARTPDIGDNRALCQELQRLAERETELAFDPGWFDAFAACHPAITSVETAYKASHFSNELVDYRYDVVLRKGGSANTLTPDLILEPDLNSVPPADYWRQIKSRSPDCVLLKNLIHARRHDAFHYLATLRSENGTGHEETPPARSRSVLCEPDALIRDANALGYEAILLPDPEGSAAHFAALLVRAGPDVSLWSHRAPAHTARQPPLQLSNALQQSLTVASHDHSELIVSLQKRATAHLPGPMRPTHYIVLRDLPLTPAGKIDRSALPRPFNGRPVLRETFVAPRDALELRLADLFSKALSVTPVGVHDGFLDLGGDSLATVELLLAIEETFHIALEISAFLAQPTIESLATIINQQRDYRPATALVTLKADGAAPPLFFIHGAGGLAFTIFELGQALDGDRPVFAVQDPACDPGITPARTVEDMAAALIAQIKTVQSGGPYWICGHSFGGLLAYEMAMQLRDEGHGVAFLGMLDTPTPPATAKREGTKSRLRLLWREMRFFGQIVTQAGPMAMDGCYVLFGAEARFHNTGGASQTMSGVLKGLWANVLFRYFHRRAGLASAIERDSRLLMLRQPGIRRSIKLTGIHDTARRQYHPRPYGGPIVLFRAETDSAETQGFADETLGWNRLASQIAIHRSPGTHFTMTRGKNIEKLSQVLNRALEMSGNQPAT